MQQVTSADAQNRFGQLLDMAQREPVAITRHGRTAGYVISVQDMAILINARQRRGHAVADLDAYIQRLDATRLPGAAEITEADIAHEIKAARAEHGRQRVQAHKP